MYSTPYTQANNASKPERSIRDARSVRWWDDLDVSSKVQVVAPMRFDLFREYEMAAERIVGYDENEEPCYCAFRHVLTELRSDDDEVFYEAPTHAESLTSWRLRDERWLVFRNIVGSCERGTAYSFFTFSEAMPR